MLSANRQSEAEKSVTTIIRTSIPEIFTIRPRVFLDNRGSFSETHNPDNGNAERAADGRAGGRFTAIVEFLLAIDANFRGYPSQFYGFRMRPGVH
jgi:hypothetical protein